jgi:hypothetical protein
MRGTVREAVWPAGCVAVGAKVTLVAGMCYHAKVGKLEISQRFFFLFYMKCLLSVDKHKTMSRLRVWVDFKCRTIAEGSVSRSASHKSQVTSRCDVIGHCPLPCI